MTEHQLECEHNREKQMCVIIFVAGLVFPVHSLCPWTGETFAFWSRIHTKSAGRPMAHGGSVVSEFSSQLMTPCSHVWMHVS